MHFQSVTTFWIALALVIAMVTLARRRMSSALRPSRGDLAMLCLVLAALASPVLELKGEAGGKIVVAVDRSASASPAAEELLERLARDPPRDLTMEIHEGVTTGVAQSDLGALLEAAAARLGGAEGDGGGRIVLASDGIDLGGRSVNVARSLAARGIVVDTLPLIVGARRPRIVALNLPERAMPGQVIEVVVVLAGGPAGGIVRVSLIGADDEDAVSVLATASVPAGEERERVALNINAPSHPGIARLFVEYECAESSAADPVAAINPLPLSPPEVYASASFLVGEKMTLALIGDPAVPAELLAESSHLELPQGELDEHSIQAIARCDAAIVAGAISADDARVLEQLAQVGGLGVLLVGGDRSFGAGGWQDHALGELSPLECDPEDREPASVVVLVDHSGSMDARRVAVARAALSTLAGVLSDGDMLAVAPFADGLDPTVRARLADGSAFLRAAPAAGRAAFAGQVLGAVPAGAGSGPTRLAPALEVALSALAPIATAGGRLPILMIVTDAELDAAAGGDLENSLSLLATRAIDVRLFIVHSGDGSAHLSESALVAAGVRDASVLVAASDSAVQDSLGQVLVQAFAIGAGERWFIESNPGLPIAPVPDSNLQLGTGDLGLVVRQNKVAAKDGAVVLLRAGERPFAAIWRRGRGEIAAIAGAGAGAGAGWGGGVLDDRDFFATILDRIAGTRDAPFDLSLHDESDGALRVWLRDRDPIDDGASGSLRQWPQARLNMGDAVLKSRPMIPEFGGWSARFGAHEVAGGGWIEVSTGVEVATRRVMRPVPIEYATLAPDLQRLEDIALAGGGKLMTVAGQKPIVWSPVVTTRTLAISPLLLLIAAALVAFGCTSIPLAGIGRLEGK